VIHHGYKNRSRISPECGHSAHPSSNKPRRTLVKSYPSLGRVQASIRPAFWRTAATKIVAASRQSAGSRRTRAQTNQGEPSSSHTHHSSECRLRSGPRSGEQRLRCFVAASRQSAGSRPTRAQTNQGEPSSSRTHHSVECRLRSDPRSGEQRLRCFVAASRQSAGSRPIRAQTNQGNPRQVVQNG
jgi:hypothetical protein